ncbi:hypothetical protein CHS0354_038445 [Potamilus streckersoni]|uniref:Uncharacterized protein n=1 Tax=Potamilus streckersoni TaxID=2493646 RepID=A0AAE0S664_9BIVA|nr:hypothetical protein CHS0354_038445 [Potamilus streckersoni]
MATQNSDIGISLKVYQGALKLGRLNFVCSPGVRPVREKECYTADNIHKPPMLELSFCNFVLRLQLLSMHHTTKRRQRWSLA